MEMRILIIPVVIVILSLYMYTDLKTQIKNMKPPAGSHFVYLTDRCTLETGALLGLTDSVTKKDALVIRVLCDKDAVK